MAIGNNVSSDSVNQTLTSLAVGLRDLMTIIKQRYEFISASGGVTFLEGLGYSAGDAATVMTMLGYLNGLSAVYFGTGTQAAASNFDAALAVLWAGQ